VGRLEKKRAHRAVEAARACRAKGKTVGPGTGLGALEQKTTAGTSTAPAGQADGVDACGCLWIMRQDRRWHDWAGRGRRRWWSPRSRVAAAWLLAACRDAEMQRETGSVHIENASSSCCCCWAELCRLGGPGIISIGIGIGIGIGIDSQPGSVSAVASSATRHSSPALLHLAAHPAAKSTAAEWSPCRATLTLTLLHMNLEPALPPSARRANTTSAVPRVALHCTTHHAPRTTHHAPLSRLPCHPRVRSTRGTAPSAPPASLLCRHSTKRPRVAFRARRPPPTPLLPPVDSRPSTPLPRPPRADACAPRRPSIHLTHPPPTPALVDACDTASPPPPPRCADLHHPISLRRPPPTIPGSFAGTLPAQDTRTCAATDPTVET
jgi:hypothetical protein